MRLQTALIYDGVLLLAEAFKRIGMEQMRPMNLECSDQMSTWNRGYTVNGFMKGVRKKERLCGFASYNLSQLLATFPAHYSWDVR